VSHPAAAAWRDPHGNTPLMVAAQNGHKRMAKALLKAQADCNAANHAGNTAMHFAVTYGYEALAKYLQSHGADDSITNISGKSCFEGI